MNRAFAALVSLMLLAGCAGEPPPEPSSTATPEPAPRPTTVALSADLFNGSVSLLDLDRLIASDGTYEGALLDQVALAAPGEIGPLTAAVTADGGRAVVLMSPGVLAFVGGRMGVDTETLPMTGAGLALLDLETREVIAGRATDDLPIMVALDEARGRAVVSLFGGAERNGGVAVYDLATLDEIERVEVAPFVEGLALNDAGTRGAVIGATAGLFLFDPADVAGTLSQTPLRLADDTSGLAFVPGTDLVAVANSRNPANLVVVDAADLDAPVVTDEGPVLDATPFMVAAVPGRQEVVLPLSRNDSLRFQHLDLSTSPAAVLRDIEIPDIVTFPEAVHVSPDGRYAFVGAEVSRELLVIDLSSGEVLRRPWLPEIGPTALMVVP